MRGGRVLLPVVALGRAQVWTILFSSCSVVLCWALQLYLYPVLGGS